MITDTMGCVGVIPVGLHTAFDWLALCAPVGRLTLSNYPLAPQQLGGQSAAATGIQQIHRLVPEPLSSLPLEDDAQSACHQAAGDAHRIHEGGNLDVLVLVVVGAEEHKQAHATRHQQTRQHRARGQRAVDVELRDCH